MKTLVLKILFIVSASGYIMGQKFGKHVYVSSMYTWNGAQRYCKDHHTDLSPLTTSWEEVKLKNAIFQKVYGAFWIGLYKQETYWKWTGGGHATNILWSENEPHHWKNGTVACVCWHGCIIVTGWQHFSPNKILPFFCFSMTVMEEMTWEQALWHCKEKHTTLTSLASETEQLLVLNEIQHDYITDQVWIGLCFLGDRWLWVDGSPLLYKSWREGDQDHQCPGQNYCRALNKNGVWENLDCEEKLNFICC